MAPDCGIVSSLDKPHEKAMTVQRKRAATIRDVADAAQVSTATVSKFVNGNQRFTAAVEARISQAVRDLGYSLNPMARGMITGQTM